MLEHGMAKGEAPAAAAEAAGAPAPFAAVPAVVLGAGGYVGAELLRLIAGHPCLRLAAAVSGSLAGTPIAAAFPHLAAAYTGNCFAPADALEAMLEAGEEEAARTPLAVFSALPHGRSAPAVDGLLTAAADAGRNLAVVDLSADFRHRDPEVYERLYGHPHPAPARLATFTCALPDLDPPPGAGGEPWHRLAAANGETAVAEPARPDAVASFPPIAHPGCFTTAVVLAAAPLVALGLVEPRLAVTAVTGSTGSGREPSAGTHHPDRHGDLRAYAPLTHRHRREMEALLARVTTRVELPGHADAPTPATPSAPAQPPEVAFVPCSGPFARGIHATVSARLHAALATAELASRLEGFYQGNPFVTVAQEPPRLKHVVGTNRCHLGVVAHGHEVVVLAVIDNLVKGAAGGAVQWMNRLLGLDERMGLDLPGLGWT